MSEEATEKRSEVGLEEIVALCKRRGFIFPSSEIYGGVGSTYDYGHYGVLLRNNVKNEWWRAMLTDRDDIVALDSAIIQHPRVWEASGHLAGFSDPLVECKVCKKRFREDQLEIGECGKKPSKIPGDGPDCDLGEARDFNLMFKTQVGPVADSSSDAYLRPETAQGIFINFKNVLQFARKKPPFGIAQIGKSFRNEITTGNFVFRTREFEQMEMEFFCPPDEAEKWHQHWLDERMRWYTELGIRPGNLILRPHDADELSHYSSATSDIEYLFPMGYSELEGIANRGDFDLSQHAEFSGEKLEYFDQQSGERYVPHVIEPAAGVDRATLAFLVDAYWVEEVEGRERTVLSLHPKLAPVKVAVLPLVNKEGMDDRARELYESLKRRIGTEYDSGGSIGKRYRRHDEIGTPWCVTIDGETADDDAVTLRDRDTLEQTRIPIADLAGTLLERLEAALDEPEGVARAVGEPANREDYPQLLPIQTRWNDNDVYGHVNNVEYYAFFDTVINHWLITEGGLEITGDDPIGVCAESHCTYRKGLSFPETVEAGLRVGELGNSSVRYEIGIFRQGEEEAGAEGWFVHVFVDAASRKPVPVPDRIRTALERIRVPAAASARQGEADPADPAGAGG